MHYIVFLRVPFKFAPYCKFLDFKFAVLPVFFTQLPSLFAMKLSVVTLCFLLLLVVAQAGSSLDPHYLNAKKRHGDDMPMMPADSTADVTPEMSPIPHVMKHEHGKPILETHLLPQEKLFWENYNTTTYFSIESPHKPSLYVHVVTLVLAIVFVYPICLLLNNINHRHYLVLLTVHTALMLVSLLNYSIFINSIEELYPHNAYNTMTWILFFSTISHWVVAIVSRGYKYLNVDNEYDFFRVSADDEEDQASTSASLNSPASFDTGHSTVKDSNLFELQDFNHHLKTSQNSMMQWAPPSSGFLKSLLEIKGVKHTIKVFGSSSIYVFNFLNWGHFFYYLIYFPTMIATFALLGKGPHVFNLLAHFIKGGVFFSFGIFTLARYCGAFQNKGWSWNYKFIFNSRNLSKFDSKWQSKGCMTMEFLESSLILFYGCTNIFLEHLSNSGGEWSAKDLQHASIAFIFIGCGFCGVLTEMKLADWRYNKAANDYKLSEDHNPNKTLLKASPGFSPNPFPVLTIYWTGILMSSHQQASELSTAIHIQWGNLFILGCVFRFLTYILFTIAPAPTKNLTQPTRPITELISSFSLLCGGLIFMESTDPVIYVFEYYGLTEMFTLNVSLGFVTLFMGWEMAIFAIKDWLVDRQKGNLSINHA